MSTSPALSQLRARLERLYGSRGATCGERICSLVETFARQSRDTAHHAAGSPWSERDVVLITYADQIRSSQHTPLAALREFLLDEQFDTLLSTVHLLPFYPYSSDDGFSVIDYQSVDPQVGDWLDVAQLGEQFDLMFDLVLNHVSQQSEWFQKYLAGEAPYEQFFIDVDPATDLSAVVRPRSLPLLTPFDTNRGQRHLWTTFSADQVDLNYAEPEVLVRMVEVLLDYVRRGARMIRLDAVAYLWKEVGTPSIHLWQTHEVVKLFREVVAAVAPDVLLLTETNVPHRENVSYFGEGDEAHMVYQFSLPPLLLDAFASGDATPLAGWLEGLSDPLAGTTYFNFTASHDGVGVRPLEGLVSSARLEQLVAAVERRGGLVSTRRRPNGSDAPYELNISYVDALAPDKPDAELHARRFLATQAVMLALRGIPAVYFHSLVGTQNDVEAARHSGHPRRINRRKFSRSELHEAITAEDSLQQRIYVGYRHLLQQRIAQPALHPDAPQQVIDTGNPALFAFQRTALDGGQRMVVAVNVGAGPQTLRLADQVDCRRDLISGRSLAAGQALELAPAQAVWLCTE